LGIRTPDRRVDSQPLWPLTVINGIITSITKVIYHEIIPVITVKGYNCSIGLTKGSVTGNSSWYNPSTPLSSLLKEFHIVNWDHHPSTQWGCKGTSTTS
jgi:hypothetical protein